MYFFNLLHALPLSSLPLSPSPSFPPSLLCLLPSTFPLSFHSSLHLPSLSSLLSHLLLSISYSYGLLSISPLSSPSSSSFPPFLSQACVQTVEALSAGQPITEEDLVLLGQLPDPIYGYKQFYSMLRFFLLSMRSNPVVTLLMLQESQQQEVSLEELFERAEVEDSAEVHNSPMSGFSMLFRSPICYVVAQYVLITTLNKC